MIEMNCFIVHFLQVPHIEPNILFVENSLHRINIFLTSIHTSLAIVIPVLKYIIMYR